MTEAMHRVLVIDDEPDIRRILRVLLQAQNFRVVEAEDARRGEIEARANKPDVMIIDLGLPDGDGVDLVRRVRAWSPLPIIVLSARTQEAQKVAALDAGADDYVTKPFGAPELLARVRAALRRGIKASPGGAVLQLDAIRVDLGQRTTTGPDGPIHLTPLEYRVLEALARQQGLIVTKKQLLREAWGPGHSEESAAVRVCIRNLREKLEAEPSRPRWLLTESGVGYRLKG